MKINEERLEQFSNDMKQAYEHGSVIGDILSTEKYDKDRHADIKFLEIARRTKLPKKFFKPSGNYVNTQLAKDFARSIYLGERNFILKNLIESKEQSEIIKGEIEEFTLEELEQKISSTQSFNHIFIPIDFHEKVYEWAGDALKFVEQEEFLEIGDIKPKVHWLPGDTDIEEIILINSDEIEIIFKEFSQREQEIENIEFEFNDNQDRFMLIFGECEEEKKKFNFLMKSVISKPRLEKNSASVIDTPL